MEGPPEEAEQPSKSAFKIPKRRNAAEPPKQSLQGLSQTWQPGLSEFCIGLRGPGVEQVGVRDRMVDNAVQAGYKMVARLEKLAWARAKSSKHRDRALEMIQKFRQMVGVPRHEDIMQLEHYLKPFLKDEINPEGGQSKKLKQSRTTRSMTPLGSMSATAKPTRTWGKDVRKDEWWSLGQLKASQAQLREREEQDQKVLQGMDSRMHLASAKASLLKNREIEMEEERKVARHLKQQHQAWLEKEKARKQTLQNKHLTDQAEMFQLQQEAQRKLLAQMDASLQEDHLQAKKLEELIQLDKANAERKMMKMKSEMERVMEFNAREQEKKKAEILRIRAEDIQAMKDYEAILDKREKERRAALAALFRNQADQADKAAAIEAAAAEAERMLDAKNKAHQEVLARKQDEAEAARALKQQEGRDDCLAALNKQKIRLKKDDDNKLQVSRDDAVEAKMAYLQGVRQDEAKAQRRLDQNYQHRRDIERQIKQYHGFLKDGCGERGMTDFERRYNSNELAQADVVRRTKSIFSIPGTKT